MQRRTPRQRRHVLQVVEDPRRVHLHPAHHPGGSFEIRTVSGSPEDVYVQTVTLNGAPLEQSRITHAEITAGGELVVTLGPEPSTWGQ